MKSHRLFVSLFSVFILSIQAVCSFAMDDGITIMKRDVATLVPTINSKAEGMLRTVNRLYGTNPQASAKIYNFEKEIHFLVDDLQLGITKFQDAYNRHHIHDCNELYEAIMDDWHRLRKINQNIQRQIIRHAAPAIPRRMVAPVEHHRAPVRIQQQHEAQPIGHARYYTVDEIAGRALESSRMARQAHLSRYPGHHTNQVPLTINPDQLSHEGFQAIPESLARLPRVQILYYPSPNLPARAWGCCGTRAIGNALGISDAVASNSLNPRTVFNNAARHNDLNSHSAVNSDEAVDLALTLNLPELHCLGIVERYADRVKPNPFSIFASTRYSHPQLGHSVNVYTEDRYHAELMQRIRNSDNIVAHFWTSVDRDRPSDHCVLISIVKRAGHIPKIIYMDSLNVPILDQSKDAAFIHYLYLQCIA